MKKFLAKCLLLFTTGCLWQSCSYDTLQPPINCDLNPVVVQLVAVKKSTCNASDGSFEVTASGGVEPYLYKYDNQTEQVEPLFANLASGTYEVTVSDANGCKGKLSIKIDTSDGVTIQLASTDAGCKSNNASVTVTAAEGATPYSFKLNEGAFQLGNVFGNLAQGEYTIVAKDANGCQTNQKIRVRSGVSFSANISSIVQNNCAVNGCHNGSQSPDLRTIQNIQTNAAQIKTRTANRSMPQGRTITQDEINTIACWVDDGALNN